MLSRSHLIILFCTCFCIPAAHAGLPNVPSNQPLLAALREGNRTAVHRIETEHDDGANALAVNRARLDYDVPHLLRAVKQCELKGLQIHAIDDLMGALYCNAMARSAALMLGDAHTFLAQALWARSTLLPAVQAALHHEASFDNGLGFADLRRLVKHTPSMKTQWSASQTTLPVLSKGINVDKNAPHVRIVVDGQPVTAALDTSFPIPSILTIIEPQHATKTMSEQLGLSLLVPSYRAVTLTTSTSGSYPTHASLFLAKSVTFGPLTVHNVAVTVIQSDYVPPMVVIGMPMLRHFGEITIGRGHVTLAKHSRLDCLQPIRMTFASGLSFTEGYVDAGALLFPVSSHHTGVRAILGTANAESVVDANAKSLSLLRSSGAKTALNGTAPANLQVKVGSQRLHLPAKEASKWSHPYQLSIGSSVLQNYTVSLNFSGSTPAICFSRANRK